MVGLEPATSESLVRDLTTTTTAAADDDNVVFVVVVVVVVVSMPCSLRRQVAAINKLSDRGMFFWDYGNAFLLEASRAGNVQ